jgi:hypothetical protein
LAPSKKVDQVEAARSRAVELAPRTMQHRRCLSARTWRCLRRQDFMAHSWPKRRSDDWLNHAERRRGQSQKCLQTTAFRDVRRRASWCPTRPVTPEVAGSIPVAPVSKSACKWGLAVAFPGALTDRERTSATHVRRVVAGGSRSYRWRWQETGRSRLKQSSTTAESRRSRALALRAWHGSSVAPGFVPLW